MIVVALCERIELKILFCQSTSLRPRLTAPARLQLLPGHKHFPIAAAGAAAISAFAGELIQEVWLDLLRCHNAILLFVKNIPAVYPCASLVRSLAARKAEARNH